MGRKNICAITKDICYMTTYGNYIYSMEITGTDDGIIVVYDKKYGTVTNYIEIPQIKDFYQSRLTNDGNKLYICTEGNIKKLIEPKNLLSLISITGHNKMSVSSMKVDDDYIYLLNYRGNNIFNENRLVILGK